MTFDIWSSGLLVSDSFFCRSHIRHWRHYTWRMRKCRGKRTQMKLKWSFILLFLSIDQSGSLHSRFVCSSSAVSVHVTINWWSCWRDRRWSDSGQQGACPHGKNPLSHKQDKDRVRSTTFLEILSRVNGDVIIVRYPFSYTTYTLFEQRKELILT